MGIFLLAGFAVLGAVGWVVGGSSWYLTAGIALGVGTFLWHRSRRMRMVMRADTELTQVVDGVSAAAVTEMTSALNRISHIPTLAPLAMRALEQIRTAATLMSQLTVELGRRIDSSDRTHWRLRARFELRYVSVLRRVQLVTEEIGAFEESDLDELRAAQRLSERRLKRGKISQAEADSARKRWTLWESASDRVKQQLDENEQAITGLLDAQAKLRALGVGETPPAEIVAVLGEAPLGPPAHTGGESSPQSHSSHLRE